MAGLAHLAWDNERRGKDDAPREQLGRAAPTRGANGRRLSTGRLRHCGSSLTTGQGEGPLGLVGIAHDLSPFLSQILNPAKNGFVSQKSTDPHFPNSCTLFPGQSPQMASFRQRDPAPAPGSRPPALTGHSPQLASFRKTHPSPAPDPWPPIPDPRPPAPGFV
jgi:hypothetical protein